MTFWGSHYVRAYVTMIIGI